MKNKVIYIYFTNEQVNKLENTSVYSAEPIRPNSSAPQLPKMMDLRGLHLPATRSVTSLIQKLKMDVSTRWVSSYPASPCCPEPGLSPA